MTDQGCDVAPITDWVRIPRFTAAFFAAPKPCEDALADLGIAYNRLADQVEAAWAQRDELVEALEAWNVRPSVSKTGAWDFRVAPEKTYAALAKARGETP